MDGEQTANQLSHGSASWRTWTERILRWALGVIFVVAAVPKILHPELFAESVNNYKLLAPMASVNWVVMILPWLELVCAIALVIGIGARGAAWLITGMLLVFLAGLISALARGLDISCGCFGAGETGKRVGIEELIRDVLMLAAAIAVLVLGRRCSRASAKRD